MKRRDKEQNVERTDGGEERTRESSDRGGAAMVDGGGQRIGV